MSTLKYRKVAVLALVTTVGLGMAACSSSAKTAADKTVITVDCAPQKTDNGGKSLASWNADIAKFQTIHPNIQIKSISVGAQCDTPADFTARIQGGTQADVFYGYMTDLQQVLDADAAEDITSYINNDTVPAYGSISDIAKNAFKDGGKTYALPYFSYAMGLVYNKTLFQQAGLTMPHNPTWAQVESFAAKLNQPGKVSGICLRGLAGWGDNMAALDTVVNTFGGQWFDMNWKPQLTSPPFVEATNFYVNLVRKYGEPGAANDSFNQLLTLYGQGKCAMWYDATVAATSIATTYPDVYKQTGYALAPVNKTKSSGWLWTWALGIPQGASDSGAAWKFVSWATSKQYDSLVAQKYSWSAVPPGTRTSLYSNPDYKKAAAPFADITLESINSTDPEHPTLNPVPYTGIQYVVIPQFESLGLTVGQQVAGAIAGTESVSQALQAGQSAASQYTPAQLSGSG